MHDLNAFQRDLLFAVAGNGGAKGLALKDAMEAYGYLSVTHGRLYQNLDALVEKGLVKKGEQDGRTNAYSVTERGDRELQDRRAWEAEQLQRRITEVTA